MIWNIKKKKTTNENKKKKNNKENPEDIIISLWVNFKQSNICIIGVQERKEKEQGIGNLFEK